MKRTVPPRTLERCLTVLLSARDREAVSGDLLEEYSEHRLPRFGRTRANLWYAWQVLSFVPRSAGLHAIARRALTLCCFFTALAGSWLGFMDIYLHHTHIAMHEAIAGTIVGQALLTLLALRFRHVAALNALAVLGCAAIGSLVAKVFLGIMRSAEIEGYILLIAFALLCQATLTLLTVWRTPPGATRTPVKP